MIKLKILSWKIGSSIYLLKLKLKIMKEIPCWREKWIEKNSIHGFKIGGIFYIKHTNFPLSDVEKAVRKYEKGVKSTNPFKIPGKTLFSN